MDLGPLLPEDVLVELVVTRGENCDDTIIVVLEHKGALESGSQSFQGGYRVELAGRYSHGMRVRVPGHGRHDAKVRGLVLWA